MDFKAILRTFLKIILPLGSQYYPGIALGVADPFVR